jgi:transposase
MARVAGIAASTVQGIWKAHGLSPHRWRQFKLSNDPAFADKLTTIVGLYVDPPAHAVVLSVDEKSQIQALDRTQPGLPMKKGRAGTITHDYKRHGTTTLFAALNVLDGTVIAQNMQRHRHQEFIRFLNRIEREVPGDKAIHVILDNYAAHKKDKVRALARAPSALDLPLHADLLLLAQCRRGILRQTHPAQAQARRLPLRRRSPGSHQPLRSRIQCRQPQAIRLESRSRRHHRRPKPRVPNVGINPLEDKAPPSSEDF